MASCTPSAHTTLGRRSASASKRSSRCHSRRNWFGSVWTSKSVLLAHALPPGGRFSCPAIQCCAMNPKRLVPLLLIWCVVIASTSCTMWSEKKHANWKSATSGEHLVSRFGGDVNAKDWQNLEAHIGSGFVGLSPAGTGDRKKVLEHLRGMDLQDFQIGELQSQMAGGDLIVT